MKGATATAVRPTAKSVTGRELEEAARASIPGREPALPEALMPQFDEKIPNLGFPQGQYIGAEETTGAAEVGEFFQRKRTAQMQEAKKKWLDLVEQARNEMNKQQRMASL